MREVFQKSQAATSGTSGVSNMGRVGVGRVGVAMRTGCLAGIVSLAGYGLTGCMAYRSADQSRAEHAIAGATMTASDWPGRDTTCLEAIRDATPKLYHRLELTGEKSVDQLLPAHARLVTEPSMIVKFNEIMGPGLLRVVFDPNQPNPGELKSWNDIHQGFHPNAWFLSSLTLNDPRRPGMLAQQRRFRAKDEASNPSSGVRYNNEDLTTAIKEGIPICFPPVQKVEPRGLLIHFVAIMGNGYEGSVMKDLRDDGWAVIDIDSNPRIMGGGRTYTINDDHDLVNAADSLARRVDDVLAEHAYAAEAALEYCRKNRPDLPTDRVAMIGFSAGSLVCPTVAARLGDDVQATVLIAGGANLLHIAMESALSDGGIHIKWGKGRGGQEDKDRLCQLYLDRSRLDPYRTATTLANKPVLQYFGQWDKWVPAKSGRILSERLNNPDKVTFLGGHALLFYFLPGQGGRICDWIDYQMRPETRVTKNTAAPTGSPASRTETTTR